MTQDCCLCFPLHVRSDMVAIHTCLTSSNRDAGNDLFNWLAIGTWILPAISSPLPLPQPQLVQQTFVGILFAWVLNVLCQIFVSFFLTLLQLVLFFARGFVHPLIIGVTTYGHRVGALLLSLGSLPFGGTTFKFLVFRFQPSSFFRSAFQCVGCCIFASCFVYALLFFVMILACKALGPSAGIIGGYLAVYPTLDNAVL